MQVETFFELIRQNQIDLMNRDIQGLGSARVPTTLWIELMKEYADGMIDRVSLPCKSKMTEIFHGSDLNEKVNEMFAYMKTQIENSACIER